MTKSLLNLLVIACFLCTFCIHVVCDLSALYVLDMSLCSGYVMYVLDMPLFSGYVLRVLDVPVCSGCISFVFYISLSSLSLVCLYILHSLLSLLFCMFCMFIKSCMFLFCVCKLFICTHHLILYLDTLHFEIIDRR